MVDVHRNDITIRRKIGVGRDKQKICVLSKYFTTS